MRPSPPLLGALLGFALAAVDTLGLLAADVHIRSDERDLTLLIMGGFGATFAALGFVIGRLVVARRQLQADAATIRAQVAQLQASQVRLVQAEKLASLGRMAAGVAHEVRNPLGVIRSSAAYIREGLPEDPELGEACGFIVEEVDRLDAYITRILDFSRPLAPEPATQPLAALVDRAVRLGGEGLGSLNVVRDDLDEHEITGDPDLLTRLLLGLLLNAAQAGARALTFSAARAERTLRVELADDGPGVPDAAREALFEPFFTTRSDGTGLGLAMGRRIAEAHGGALTLLPSAVGARFRLTLPLGSPP
ncbi:MAG: hypothetical protein H6739_14190 [Alphaproteobacteria bacterium]|nr:hypothetical protein [Alphaproteobacteria bacterium]